MLAEWVQELQRHNLSELRRRQNICNQQIVIAYQTKNTVGLERCQMMAEALIIAIAEKIE